MTYFLFFGRWIDLWRSRVLKLSGYRNYFQKTGFLAQKGHFFMFFEFLVMIHELASYENLVICRIKLAAQASTVSMCQYWVDTDQKSQKLVRNAHLWILLRITSADSIRSIWKQLHLVPLNFSFPESIHLMHFLSILIFRLSNGKELFAGFSPD